MSEIFSGNPGTEKGSVTMAIGAQLSGAINMGRATGGYVYLPAEFNGETITWYVSDERDGTYTPANNDGSDETLTAAGGPRWVAIPSTVAMARFLKIHTGTATAAEATIKWMLKGV
jgi:hypothetical protein